MTNSANFSSRSARAIVAGLLFITTTATAALHKGQGYLRPAATEVDVSAQFSGLAQQRPWRCDGAASVIELDRGWQAGAVECAWQNRLSMRRWSGPAGVSNGCLSNQARWWRAVSNRNVASLNYLSLWQRTWTTQALIDNEGLERRILIAERMPDGMWRGTEWRWQPSPRAATRRWQEGRWALIAGRAAQLRQAPVGARPDSASGRLRAVALANVGPRVGEMIGEVLRYQTDGVCLEIDPASVGEQQLQLSYSADDSRLEQRSAVQVQLTRRFPRASWLVPFSLLPTGPSVKSGAKFYALWTEDGVLHGQLWIPTKGTGPLIRVRLSAIRAPVSAPSAPLPLAHMRPVVERELMNIGNRWAFFYE